MKTPISSGRLTPIDPFESKDSTPAHCRHSSSFGQFWCRWSKRASGACGTRGTGWRLPSARLSFYWHPLSIRIETPTKGRGGCSRMTVISYRLAGLDVDHHLLKLLGGGHGLDARSHERKCQSCCSSTLRGVFHRERGEVFSRMVFSRPRLP